jgi:hypothetical protein
MLDLEGWLRKIEDVANNDEIHAVRLANNVALEYQTRLLFVNLTDGVESA